MLRELPVKGERFEDPGAGLQVLCLPLFCVELEVTLVSRKHPRTPRVSGDQLVASRVKTATPGEQGITDFRFCGRGIDAMGDSLEVV